MTIHPFDVLIQSARALHARFHAEQSIPLALRIAEEEWREVQHEANPKIAEWNNESGQVDPVKLAHECVDLLVTLVGLCDVCGVTDAQFTEAMRAVAEKNDEKIPGQTHEINPVSKKIQRIHHVQHDTD